MSVGDIDSCAVTNAGAARCWGDNSSGQLGDTTATSSGTPQGVFGLNSGVTQIAVAPLGAWAPYRHVCAVVSGGAQCWGSNLVGQLGSNTHGGSLIPVPVVGLGSGVTSIATGSGFSCAVVSGAGQCWGAIGVNSTGPATVTGLSSGVRSVYAGGDHACAVMTAGGVKCWGSNSNGQLGPDNTIPQSQAAVDVPGLPSPASSLALGHNHTCALLTDHTTWCWGSDSHGQIGVGRAGTATTVRSRLPPTSARSAAGGDTTCVQVAGAWSCWGANDQGQVGGGTTTDPQLTPAAVLGAIHGQTLPGPPAIVLGTPGAAGAVNLQWPQPAFAGTAGVTPTDYRVTVYSTSGGSPTGVTGPTQRLVGSFTSTFTFTGLTPGVGYRFTVETMLAFLPFRPQPAVARRIPRNGAAASGRNGRANEEHEPLRQPSDPGLGRALGRQSRFDRHDVRVRGGHVLGGDVPSRGDRAGCDDAYGEDRHGGEDELPARDGNDRQRRRQLWTRHLGIVLRGGGRQLG